jgi:hypothetical protein
MHFAAPLFGPPTVTTDSAYLPQTDTPYSEIVLKHWCLSYFDPSKSFQEAMLSPELSTANYPRRLLSRAVLHPRSKS